MSAPAPAPAAAPANVTPDAWRGVAAETADEMPPGLRGFLRSRSRHLLGTLLRPHKKTLAIGSAVVVLETATKLAGPYLVQKGIDLGIPPLAKTNNYRPIAVVVVLLVGIVLLRAVLEYAFLNLSGRIGQDVLVDLRRRLYDHFQRLSLSFHERYTSGRVISRLTSDVDAISELLGTGLLSMTTGILSILGIGIVLMTLDPLLAVLILLVFPAVVGLTIWFRKQSEVVYREAREAVALVIVHFVESLGGIRAVQAFRREGRNQAIMEDVNGRYYAANIRSNRISAVYGPGINGLGRAAVAFALLIGSYRVVNGQMTVGVLAAFVFYVRRFFEPMQDLSQFYNLFQAAAAALEKLSGVLDEEPIVHEPERPLPLLEPRRSRVRGRAFRVPHDRGAARDRPRDTRRPDGRVGGRNGRRQVDGGAPHRALLRRVVRSRAARRHRSAQPRGPNAPAVGGDGDAGELPVLRHGGRQHRLRPAIRVPGRDRGGGAGHRRARLHRRAARRLRHGCTQARRPALGWSASTGRVRPRVPRRPAC